MCTKINFIFILLIYSVLASDQKCTTSNDCRDLNSKCDVKKGICICEKGKILVNGTSYCKLVQFSSKCLVSEVCGTESKCVNHKCQCNNNSSFNFGYLGNGGCNEPAIYSSGTCSNNSLLRCSLNSYCDDKYHHCRCNKDYRFEKYLKLKKNYTAFYCIDAVELNVTCRSNGDCKAASSYCANNQCFCLDFYQKMKSKNGWQCYREWPGFGLNCTKYDKVGFKNSRCVDGTVQCDEGYEILGPNKCSKKSFTSVIVYGIIGGLATLMLIICVFVIRYMRNKKRSNI